MHTFTYSFLDGAGEQDWFVCDAADAHQARAALMRRDPGATEIQLEDIEDENGILVASFTTRVAA